MSTGRCPRCARPYTPGEVTGLGILRTRPEQRGGPFLEFTCPRCGALLRLVPHGWGRYSAPGEPPPPAASPASCAPPWAEAAPSSQEQPDAVEQEGSPEPHEIPVPPGEDGDPPSADPEPEFRERVTTEVEAFEVLGIEPTDRREDVERAFRERSRTCHPDKVAHLDDDFQRLAERKFRRLRSAYDLLCHDGGRSFPP